MAVIAMRSAAITAGIVFAAGTSSAVAADPWSQWLAAMTAEDGRRPFGTVERSDDPDPSVATIYDVLRVGPSRIYCIRTPCPWRGITRLGADGRDDGRPLWAGAELPAVVGAHADRRRITAAWRDGGCILVRGRLEETGLRARGIVGDC
jgi:hypothetical protein